MRGVDLGDTAVMRRGAACCAPTSMMTGLP